MLVEKIKQYKPKIAVFNGKGIYEVFSSQKTFPLGKQAEKFEGTDTVTFFLFKSSLSAPDTHETINTFFITYLYNALFKLQED